MATTILCGTDFSDSAAQAVEVAGGFARRLSEPLVLVHAVDQDLRKNLPGEVGESLSFYARAQLSEERERMRASSVELIEAFRGGAPKAVLLEEAAAHHARIVVLAGAKRGPLSSWLSGSVSEQVAEAADVPTLIVRDPAPLLRWMRGEHRLRIFVGADFSAPSEAALRWVEWLRTLGPCDVVVAYLENPLPSYPGTDFYPSVLVEDLVLKATSREERHFRRYVRTLLGRSRVRVRFEKDWGHSDAHLIRLAVEEHADLIVTGTHSRQGWQRFGHHSVSRGILHHAPLSVACIPVRPPSPPPVPQITKS